jgi:hypothetical protein
MVLLMEVLTISVPGLLVVISIGVGILIAVIDMVLKSVLI